MPFLDKVLSKAIFEFCFFRKRCRATKESNWETILGAVKPPFICIAATMLRWGLIHLEAIGTGPDGSTPQIEPFSLGNVFREHLNTILRVGLTSFSGLPWVCRVMESTHTHFPGCHRRGD
jgi:hypothetical protein